MKNKGNTKKSDVHPSEHNPKRTQHDEISATTVAEAMVHNMAANQAEPDWEINREREHARIAHEVLTEHSEELKVAGIEIPPYTNIDSNQTNPKKKKAK